MSLWFLISTRAKLNSPSFSSWNIWKQLKRNMRGLSPWRVGLGLSMRIMEVSICSAGEKSILLSFWSWRGWVCDGLDLALCLTYFWAYVRLSFELVIRALVSLLFRQIYTVQLQLSATINLDRFSFLPPCSWVYY